MASKTKQGKEFEQDFADSFPSYVWVYRIPDNATSFGGGNNARFTQDSRYDYLCFDTDAIGGNLGRLYAFELKSTEGTSISFCPYELSQSYERSKSNLEEYRLSIKGTQTNAQKDHIKVLKDNMKSLEKKCKAPSIKYHQIKNLYDDSQLGLLSFLGLNFRKTNHTYLIDIETFYKWHMTTPKKSINENDLIELKAELVGQQPIGRSKHWSYDIMNAIEDYRERLLQQMYPDGVHRVYVYEDEDDKVWEY